MGKMGWLVFLAWPLWAQNHILDLRPIEIDDRGEITYQNFIYSRYLLAGKVLLSAAYIHLPPAKYREFALGAGYNIATFHDLHGYLLGSLSSTTGGYYFEPAVIGIGKVKRLFAFFYLTHYLPLDGDGSHQWLLDPFELQYVLVGPFAVGFSSYYYRPHGGEPLYKLGGKLSYAFRYGSFDLALRQTNSNHRIEAQLRTIMAF